MQQVLLYIQLQRPDVAWEEVSYWNDAQVIGVIYEGVAHIYKVSFIIFSNKYWMKLRRYCNLYKEINRISVSEILVKISRSSFIIIDIDR